MRVWVLKTKVKRLAMTEATIQWTQEDRLECERILKVGGTRNSEVWGLHECQSLPI